MSQPTRLLLLRHGEVEAAYQGVFGGRIDMELSPEGHQQARHLADALRATRLDGLYVSPLKRARQTVAPLAGDNGHLPAVFEGLSEVDFGAWTGLTWGQVRQQFGVSAFTWLAALERGDIPGAEPVLEFRARVQRCVRSALALHPGGTVALVCHGGVIRMALAALLELPLQKLAGFEIDYASVTVVNVAPGKAEVQLLNFTPWRSLP